MGILLKIIFGAIVLSTLFGLGYNYKTLYVTKFGQVNNLPLKTLIYIKFRSTTNTIIQYGQEPISSIL